MFDTKTTPIATRLTDAVDLIIDFATLGEYGLEPVQAPARRCEARGRGRSTRAPIRAPGRTLLR
jgi:hypothetical protein